MEHPATDLGFEGVGLLSNTMAQIAKLPVHVNAAYVTDPDGVVMLKGAD